MSRFKLNPGEWTEQFPEIRVPAARMIGSSSRFTNIYFSQPETILLDEETIEPQVATIRIEAGTTKSLADYADDPTEARQATFGSRLRTLIETAQDGPVMNMGNRLVFDARRLFNGNIAHMFGHHLAKLGYAKEKLGVDREDCLVILEKKSPRLSHAIFDFVGYETYETNRPVRGNVLDVDVKRYDSYHIAPYAANLEPSGLKPSGVERLFISRRSSRRLSNEQEILAIAKSQGYTVCYFEDVPLKEQWSLARDARSIIAIHGAALSFLSAKGKPTSSPQYRLLEILSPGLVADIFRKTSAVMGGHWLGCRGRLSSYFVKHVDESANFRTKEGEDFYLHPDAFERALAMLEISAD